MTRHTDFLMIGSPVSDDSGNVYQITGMNHHTGYFQAGRQNGEVDRPAKDWHPCVLSPEWLTENTKFKKSDTPSMYHVQVSRPFLATMNVTLYFDPKNKHGMVDVCYGSNLIAVATSAHQLHMMLKSTFDFDMMKD